jgi:hypothetical protein
MLTVALTGTKVSKALSTVGTATGAASPACVPAGAAGVPGPGASTRTSSTSTIPAGPLVGPPAVAGC